MANAPLISIFKAKFADRSMIDCRSRVQWFVGHVDSGLFTFPYWLRDARARAAVLKWRHMFSRLSRKLR